MSHQNVVQHRAFLFGYNEARACHVVACSCGWEAEAAYPIEAVNAFAAHMEAVETRFALTLDEAKKLLNWGYTVNATASGWDGDDLRLYERLEKAGRVTGSQVDPPDQKGTR